MHCTTATALETRGTPSVLLLLCMLQQNNTRTTTGGHSHTVPLRNLAPLIFVARVCSRHRRRETTDDRAYRVLSVVTRRLAYIRAR